MKLSVCGIFILICLLKIGVAIRCFQCNQRMANLVVCQNGTIEDCNVLFPQQNAVCVKLVQTFSTNQPTWVFAQCQIQAAFNASQLNTCTTAQLQAPGDTLQTCICSTELCNDAKTITQSSMLMLFPLLILIIVLAIF